MKETIPNCQWQSYIAAYHDGELAAGILQTMNIHLAGCTICQQELQALRQTSAVMNTLPLATLSPELRNQMMRRWRQQQNDRGALQMAYSLLAMAACLFICVSLWLPWNTKVTTATNTNSIVETNDTEITQANQDDLVLAAWVGVDFSRSSAHE